MSEELPPQQPYSAPYTNVPYTNVPNPGPEAYPPPPQGAYPVPAAALTPPKAAGVSPTASHHGLSVANSSEVLHLFEGHNVLGVLQGHTHINEMVLWRGVPYITSGAVSGNWWHGTRLGTPEGFTVVTVADGRLTTRYETYGFQSVAPQNT